MSEICLYAQKPFLGNIYLMLSLLLKANCTQLNVLMGGCELYYSQPPGGDRDVLLSLLSKSVSTEKRNHIFIYI